MRDWKRIIDTFETTPRYEPLGPYRTSTLAEQENSMITRMKETGEQHAASWNQEHGIVIGIIDNNKDDDKTPFEEYAKLAKLAGVIDVKQIYDGEYEWWISLFPAKDWTTADHIMKGLVGLRQGQE